MNHVVKQMEDLIEQQAAEIAKWKEKEFIACSKHHEYHEEIEQLEADIERQKAIADLAVKALEEIAVYNRDLYESPLHAYAECKTKANEVLAEIKRISTEGVSQ